MRTVHFDIHPCTLSPISPESNLPQISLPVLYLFFLSKSLSPISGAPLCTRVRPSARV